MVEGRKKKEPARESIALQEKLLSFAAVTRSLYEFDNSQL